MIPRALLKDVPSYQASKWFKLPLFLNKIEMQAFLEKLPDVTIAPLSGVIPEKETELSKEGFLALYEGYLKTLPQFSPRIISAITLDQNDLRAVPVEGGLLMRIVRPVVQVQPYYLNYSTTDGKFHEMSYSRDSLSWGLLFSFPQLFSDPATKDALKVSDEDFANAALFKSIQRFAREHTVPTPFLVNGKLINHSSRIGKQMIQDIHIHPQLTESLKIKRP